MKKLSILLGIFLLLSACSSQQVEEPTQVETFEYEAFLYDINGGVASGLALAEATPEKNLFSVTAVFEDLPELPDDEHFEAWFFTDEQLYYSGLVEWDEEGAYHVYDGDKAINSNSEFLLSVEKDDGDYDKSVNILSGTFDFTTFE